MSKEEMKNDAFTPEEPKESVQFEADGQTRDTDEIEQTEERNPEASGEESAEEAEEEMEDSEMEDEESDREETQEDTEDEADGDVQAEEESETADIRTEETEEKTYEDTEKASGKAKGRAVKKRKDEGGSEEMSSNTKKRKYRRGRRKANKENRAKLGKKAAIIAGGIVGGLALVYLGISAYFIGHFYINTEINGKDFSGRSAAAVEEYIKEQVADYELTIKEKNNETDVIKGSEISLTYKENSSIQDALEAQHPLLWPSAFFSKSSAKVTVEVGYDEAALQEKIESVKAVTQEQTKPTSAYPEFDGNSFVVAPEVYGTAVDTEVFAEKVKQYITEFKPELNMLDESCYVLPKYTSDSPEVQAACDTMNTYSKAVITYKMDENVVVDKELISGWLKYDDEMKVSIDSDAVKKWLREFGKKYDTVGKTRSITTPGGKTVDVSGGTYGWSVDEKKEATALIESIKKGETVEKEPVYEQKAASRSAQDWGSTYLEVDISAQHMWYIVDGSVALETDVVTGVPIPERATPTGVYSILEMKRNKTLVGETDPSTGQPIYETPVSYWMRVTWTGIGFHDATWQSSFGGNRYQNGAGSHGCINMPIDQAGALYGMLNMGTPVIIHN